MPLDATTATMIDTLVPIVLPALIDLIKSLHAQTNPTAPALTDAEATAALQAASAATAAKDDAWLRAHPVVTDMTGTQPAHD